MPFVIAHTKVKTIKEKGDDTEGYSTLTSDLSNDTEGIFGDIFDCVLTGCIDRNFDNNGKVTAEVRKLYLRGNGFVDAGCRFADGAVPEYIIFDKSNMAKEFIDTLEEGLRKSRTDKMSKPDFKKQQQKESEELHNKATSINYKVDDLEEKQNKLDEIKQHISELDFAKVQSIMSKYSIKDFNDVPAVQMEALDELLALI